MIDGKGNLVTHQKHVAAFAWRPWEIPPNTKRDFKRAYCTSIFSKNVVFPTSRKIRYTEPETDTDETGEATTLLYPPSVERTSVPVRDETVRLPDWLTHHSTAVPPSEPS